jgi:hypothetical protein
LVQVETLTRLVRENCEITNARHAGGYSVCGLLLRLRNLYKWERGLPPWEEPEPAAALEWVSERESAWERLAEEDFRPLELDGTSCDPLDAEAVNAYLKGSGLIYGAGFGWGLKPSFFLGKLTARRRVGGHTVHLVGRELARDLFSAPAMLSGERVVVRSDAAAYHLWDRLHDVKKSGQAALLFALISYGLDGGSLKTPDALREVFPRLAAQEIKVYARHELGELHAPGLSREAWRSIVARFPGERVELLARAVKDALADTGPRGTLAYIIRGRLAGSLGLYVAFLDGVRRLLLPGLPAAFEEFRANADWRGLELARRQAHQATLGRAATLLAVFGRLEDKGEDWVKAEVQRQLIEPLGI